MYLRTALALALAILAFPAYGQEMPNSDPTPTSNPMEPISKASSMMQIETSAETEIPLPGAGRLKTKVDPKKGTVAIVQLGVFDDKGDLRDYLICDEKYPRTTKDLEKMIRRVTEHLKPYGVPPPQVQTALPFLQEMRQRLVMVEIVNKRQDQELEEIRQKQAEQQRQIDELLKQRQHPSDGSEAPATDVPYRWNREALHQRPQLSSVAYAPLVTEKKESTPATGEKGGSAREREITWREMRSSWWKTVTSAKQAGNQLTATCQENPRGIIWLAMIHPLLPLALLYLNARNLKALAEQDHDLRKEANTRERELSLQEKSQKEQEEARLTTEITKRTARDSAFKNWILSAFVLGIGIVAIGLMNGVRPF